MTGNTAAFAITVLLAVTVRWCISLSGYSGQGKPPMFGDYEAQRHWMEITHNLPAREWYHNTTKNDLQYWGLDYPPLTAYHSWLCGLVADKINPAWVELITSRGFESHAHKLFMRSTVFVADVLLFISAAMFYFSRVKEFRSAEEKVAGLAATLMYPGLILIDYGHFQYNCASLGFALWAVALLCTKHELLGAASFCLALNYKQMELYHALPFFMYLLGNCFIDRSQNWFWRLVKISVTVVLTFVLCWLPFLTDINHTVQVLHRLFPFARGIFEDKVANIWCASSVFIKWKTMFTQEELIKYCLLSTGIYLMPSSFELLLKPTLQKFKIALVNSALVFFLFSFQVHEKSILIAALPTCLVLPRKPLASTWFLLISVFSMLPLLIKDQLLLPSIASCVLFYYLIHSLYFSEFIPGSEKDSKPSFYIFALFYLSLLGAVVLTIGTVFVSPPPRYPDLWAVLVSIYSCGHFVCFLIYFHWVQFTAVEESSNKIQTPIKKQKNQKKD